MAQLPPERAFLYEEEVDYKSGVSESLMIKTGKVINFINERQHGERGFFVNGPYSAIAGAQTGVDGFWIIPYDIEILGVTVFNLVAGSSGTTTFDLHRFTAPGVDAGSVFSVKPALASTAGNHSYVGVISNGAGYTTIGGGTGMTAPTLSTINLNQGDALRFDLDAKMTGAQNCGLIVYFRPR